MERTLFKGDIIKLNVLCLRNLVGTLGVVYEEYDIGFGPGVSVIFENSEYDGFGIEDQDYFFEKVGHDTDIANYQFKNVSVLFQDFNNGIFDSAFSPESDIERDRRLAG